MKKYIGMGLVIMTLFFVGCSAEDSSDDTTSGTITATINGTRWKGAKIVNVSLMQVNSIGEQRFDISAQDGKQMLSLAFLSELTTKGMPVRTYSFDNDDALFLNTYLIGNSTFTEHSPVSGQLTITAMDADKKTISGTFSFQNEKVGILQTEIITPELVNVTEGVFTNLSYKVITEK
ncbi:hypothetical protein BXU11_08375 [Flavobacterium sp. LM5]|uniref:DUF6252 family protein n=1 Tax=Flavobacterium sp. LM5 TaxID=1938610 RepID=UPI0009D260DE|nr:DUF6252 family protein [Flavobacterium sp. LM5]OOV29864.1 hypothetical protein BXU11_08375 [Flavobacterium sp. LM5]